MQAQMFFRIGFTNWKFIEKYFRMNILSSVSANSNLLGLLCWVRVEAHFQRKVHLCISFRSLFRLLAVLSGTLRVESRGYHQQIT